MKSKRIDDNLNPVWSNERLQLSWNGKDILQIDVYDHDNLKKDDDLGHCEVVLSEYVDRFASQGVQSFDCPLENVKSGTIQFDLEFIKLA